MQGNNYVSDDQNPISKNYEFIKHDGLKVKDSHNKTIKTEKHVLSNDHSAVTAKGNESCTKETREELMLIENVQESRPGRGYSIAGYFLRTVELH